MEELIGRITASAGIDAATARRAVGTILTVLYDVGPRDKMADLAARIPDAASYIDTSDLGDSATLGGLGGLMGGGAFAVLGQLQELGLDMGQIQGVAQETIDFAREKGGAALVDSIVAEIPGLGQFV